MPMPGDRDGASRTGIAKSGNCKKWQLFEGESIGAERSASELTSFLGGAADEAAIARDAGTRDGGQRYWGGE